MNKLQLYITKSFGGYKTLLNINPSAEVSHYVRELTDVVSRVNYDASEKNIFYYVTLAQEGIFTVIIRTIPHNKPDHLAAWIYVPHGLTITGNELEQVVSGVTRRISGERVLNEDVNMLRELFSKDYIEDPETPALPHNAEGDAVAWRRYGGNTNITLEDLMGKGLFQVPYLDYNGILLVDDELGITVEGADLTDMPIEAPATILPVAKTPQNFVPFVFGSILDKPIRATLNSNVAFVWKCPGFEDVIKNEVITTERFEPTQPDTTKSRKSISTASFQIASNAGSIDASRCEITVNGIKINTTPGFFTADELTSALVTIVCDGYAPYNARLDLASATRTLVRLHERTKVYCFEMPVKSADLGAPVKFKIYTKKRIIESPIEGYIAQNHAIEDGEAHINYLSYSPSKSTLTKRITDIVIGVVAGLLIGMLFRCGGSDKPEESVTEDNTVAMVQNVVMTDNTAAKEPNATEPAKETKATNNTAKNSDADKATQPQATTTKIPTANAPVTAEAIKYLDTNKRWTKDILESQAGLQGLYDDMINYRLDVIISKWGPKLKASQNFARIVEHAQKGNTPTKRAKSGIDKTTYPGGAEQRINIIDYLNKIDP
ncbi:MAG: hypothetical protein J1F20_07670 [Muribaculaceae bacterium]|nr:hypothetical protein [Muribaculaceae bacterium]